MMEQRELVTLSSSSYNTHAWTLLYTFETSAYTEIVILRMHGTYITNKKFDYIRILVLCDTAEIYIKIDFIKDVNNIYFAL